MTTPEELTVPQAAPLSRCERGNGWPEHKIEALEGSAEWNQWSIPRDILAVFTNTTIPGLARYGSCFS